MQRSNVARLVRLGDAPLGLFPCEAREASEQLPPALCHEPGELGLVVGEEDERRGGSELLTLEEQRRAGGEQEERGERAMDARARELVEPRAAPEFDTWSWFSRKSVNAGAGRSSAGSPRGASWKVERWPWKRKPHFTAETSSCAVPFVGS